MNRYDKDTAVLRHLADGPKFEADFNQTFSPAQRAKNTLMRSKSVGGMRALWRCEAGGWVSTWEHPDYKYAPYYQITETGRAELERRERESK